jgi:hypothetical protein
MGLVFHVAIVAVVVVVAVAAIAFLKAKNPSGAPAQAFEAISGSKTVALLVAERQELIDMNAAAHTLTVSVHPKVVSPTQVVAAANEAAQQQSQNNTSQNQGPPPGPPPNPGTAESIGYQMLPEFGYSQSSQWGCLLHLWMRESGWSYDAENASGAYGIPQALPGYKMAAAGSDWRTDPRTQIRWGIEDYIKPVYGSPCGAWDHEVNYGWY